MRNLSSFIASTAQQGEERPASPWAVGGFVIGLLVASSAAAFFIGEAIADRTATAPVPAMAFADEGF